MLVYKPDTCLQTRYLFKNHKLVYKLEACLKTINPDVSTKLSLRAKHMKHLSMNLL